MKTKRLSWVFLGLAFVSAYATYYQYQLTLNIPILVFKADKSFDPSIWSVHESAMGGVMILAGTTLVFLLIWAVLLTRPRK